MTVNNAHAYCDESGNTGANLLDPNQPLLVVGGWLVNDGLIEAAEQIVREHIELIAPLDNELHGIRLLRNEAGTEPYSIWCKSFKEVVALFARLLKNVSS